jgi:Ala-tRNA(Pro) deacylase
MRFPGSDNHLDGGPVTGFEVPASLQSDATDAWLTAHDDLMAVLDRGMARFRVIDHRPEGNTAAASDLRGHPLAEAAKSIVVRIGKNKRRSRYALVVVPGNRRIDLTRIGETFGARSASFATAEVAERLSGAVCGSIVPFSFRPDLDLLVDPALLVHREIYFNAARLDRSLALNTDDYVRLAQPRLHEVAQSDAQPL